MKPDGANPRGADAVQCVYRPAKLRAHARMGTDDPSNPARHPLASATAIKLADPDQA